jgi:uncharacterized protein (TIGR02594 family)
MMDAPWYRVARQLVGIKEVPGPKADPRILELFQLAGFPDATRRDETAWCAAFVGACLRLAGFSNKATLLAAGYLDFGQDLGRDPVEGCIVVTEPLAKGASGHVAFYVGEKGNDVILLGGNQHDSVKESHYPKKMVRSYRWPVAKSAIATSDLIKNITQLEPGFVSTAPAPSPIFETQLGTFAAFNSVAPVMEKWEGGYVDHPNEPGGPTNMGVTLATLTRWRGREVTAEDVKALTRDEARQIYREYYWKPISGDQLPPPVALMTFNAAILNGVARAARFLQVALNRQGLGIREDGEIGPETLGAVAKSDLKRLVRDYATEQLSYLHTRPGWPTFGTGWTNRINDVQSNAAALAEDAFVVAAGEPKLEERPPHSGAQQLLALILTLLSKEKSMAGDFTKSGQEIDPVNALLPLLLQSLFSGKQIDITQLLAALLTGRPMPTPVATPSFDNTGVIPPSLAQPDLITILLPLIFERLTGKPLPGTTPVVPTPGKPTAPPLTTVNGALGQTVGNMLNGRKTAIGAIGLLATTLLPVFFPQLAPIAAVIKPAVGAAAVAAGNATNVIEPASVHAQSWGGIITDVAQPLFAALTGWGVLGKFDKWFNRVQQ